MTVTYEAPNKSGANSYQSQALTAYKELHESCNAEGVNILSENVTDILSNSVAFADFSATLSESMDENERENFDILVENTRLQILSESMISGSNPITALSLPMLRVGYPKIAVREGLPTEAVEQPKFKVTTKRPYVKGSDGSKRYLPEALVDGTADHTLPQLETTAIAATAGNISDYDLLSPIAKNSELGDEIDSLYFLTEVVLDVDGAGGANETFEMRAPLDTNNNTIHTTVTTKAGKVVTILATINRAKGLLNATAIGHPLVSIKQQGFVSSEANNAATQIGTDIEAIECVIGTAQPIESPINIQHMTDMLHMYNIDSTLSNIETMTTFLAHNTDREGVTFIDDTFNRLSKKITERFDVLPPANYTNGDTLWREELKIKIDRVVSRLQTSANMYSGHTVLFCHPLDAQVISNVKWIYSGVEQVNDVKVDYKVGQYVSGTTTYMILQSPYFSQGKIRAVYIPSEADYKTLTYYPYSFTTVRGTASSNSNSANVPVIQMIKRHLFKAFTPLVAQIVIENNAVV